MFFVRFYRLILLGSVGMLLLFVAVLGASASSFTGTEKGLQSLSCPSLSGFTPKGGVPGTIVTITGCGFTRATSVSFNGVVAAFTVNSDTQITTTVPTGATSGKIAVTTPTKALKTRGTFIVSPTLALSPSVGPPTSFITVSGSNFGSSEAVDVYFDTTDEALVSTNRQGAFAGISIQVPATAVPGTHWVTAIGRHSGLSAQMPFVVQTDWTQFRNTPTHTGSNPYENVLSPANVSSLDQAWSAATGYVIDSSPAVANGVVYVGSYDNHLHAFNAQTGTPLWSAATGGAIFSSPAVANGVVYVGSSDNNLYAYALPHGLQLTPPARPNVRGLHPNLKLHARA